MNRREFLGLLVAAPAVAASKHFLTAENAKAAVTQFPLLCVQFGDAGDAAEKGWSLQQAASVFDVIVGAYGLFTTENVAILKGGKEKLLGLYRHPTLWFDDNDDAADYTEEMFAHDARGHRIVNEEEGGFYYDPGNTAFRSLFSSNVASYVNQFGLDGVMLDGPAVDYAITPTYHLDILQLLSDIRDAVPPPKIISSNSLMAYTPSGQGDEFEFAPFVDGYSLENFMSTFPWESDPDTVYDIDTAHATIAASKRVLGLGKDLSLVTGFSYNPNATLRAQWQAFQYAAYLMVVTPELACFWNWGYNLHDEYNFPELHFDIGEPLAAAVRIGDVYTRAFANYTVVCNLGTRRGTYTPRYGTSTGRGSSRR